MDKPEKRCAPGKTRIAPYQDIKADYFRWFYDCSKGTWFFKQFDMRRNDFLTFPWGSCLENIYQSSS